MVLQPRRAGRASQRAGSTWDHAGRSRRSVSCSAPRGARDLPRTTSLRSSVGPCHPASHGYMTVQRTARSRTTTRLVGGGGRGSGLAPGQRAPPACAGAESALPATPPAAAASGTAHPRPRLRAGPAFEARMHAYTCWSASADPCTQSRAAVTGRERAMVAPALLRPSMPGLTRHGGQRNGGQVTGIWELRGAWVPCSGGLRRPAAPTCPKAAARPGTQAPARAHPAAARARRARPGARAAGTGRPARAAAPRGTRAGWLPRRRRRRRRRPRRRPARGRARACAPCARRRASAAPPRVIAARRVARPGRRRGCHRWRGQSRWRAAQAMLSQGVVPCIMADR